MAEITLNCIEGNQFVQTKGLHSKVLVFWGNSSKLIFILLFINRKNIVYVHNHCGMAKEFKSEMINRMFASMFASIEQ